VLIFGIYWLSTVAYAPTILTWIAYISPLYPYMWSGEIPYGTHGALFWKTLVVSNMFGWLLLGFTSWLLPRIWQERAILPERKGLFWRLRRQSRGSATQRDKARQKLLPINPILWLIGDEPAIRNTVWLIVFIWGMIIVALSSQDPAQSLWTAFVGTLFLGFLLKVMVASQACRFFVESRKNGSLEMLLRTPLRNRDIIRGQWLSLKRLFLWPLIVLALLNLVPIAFLVYQAFTGPGLSEALHSVPSAMASLGASCWLTFVLVADVFTVGWVGMWLGLSAKKPDLAPFWTILFVLILPLIVCPVALLVDVFLIIWASSNLQTEIRWTLSRQ
jgi:hypothetical protein